MKVQHIQWKAQGIGVQSETDTILVAVMNQ